MAVELSGPPASLGLFLHHPDEIPLGGHSGFLLGDQGREYWIGTFRNRKQFDSGVFRSWFFAVIERNE